MYMYICMCVYIYIYISLSLSIYIYIYIYYSNAAFRTPGSPSRPPEASMWLGPQTPNGLCPDYYSNDGYYCK